MVSLAARISRMLSIRDKAMGQVRIGVESKPIEEGIAGVVRFERIVGVAVTKHGGNHSRYRNRSQRQNRNECGARPQKE